MDGISMTTEAEVIGVKPITSKKLDKDGNAKNFQKVTFINDEGDTVQFLMPHEPELKRGDIVPLRVKVRDGFAVVDEDEERKAA